MKDTEKVNNNKENIRDDDKEKKNIGHDDTSSKIPTAKTITTDSEKKRV